MNGEESAPEQRGLYSNAWCKQLLLGQLSDRGQPRGRELPVETKFPEEKTVKYSHIFSSLRGYHRVRATCEIKHYTYQRHAHVEVVKMDAARAPDCVCVICVRLV